MLFMRRVSKAYPLLGSENIDRICRSDKSDKDWSNGALSYL